jgi:hypothetical protein
VTIAWTTARAAIHAWAVAGSGLPASSVRWAGQDGPRAAAPYIVLRVTGLRPMGMDWLTVQDADTPAPGAEIEHLVRGPRTATLRITAFGAAVGANAPEALLEGIMSSRFSPVRAAALYAGGVGVAGFGAVVAMDGMLNGLFEPRAVLDARIVLSSEVVETSTYIETAEITNETTGDSFVVDSTP